jgi:hypothetical protein
MLLCASPVGIRLEGLKLLVRNVDSNLHTVSLLLHEKLGNTIINSREVEFNYIPPGSDIQRELKNLTDSKGVWSITGMIIDGQIYAYNQKLPRMTQGESCFVATTVYQDPKHPQRFNRQIVLPRAPANQSFQLRRALMIQ